MGSFSAEGIEKVGSYPEGMLYNRGVMVANSDRGMGNASIENVSMKYTPWKSATSDLLICPIDIFYAGGKLCCLDKGTFDENGNQVEDHIVVNIGGEDIALPRISDSEVDQMYSFLKSLDR